jgi:ArsR family transcriptional regulator, virulence genes transcriptional regulator
MDTFASADGSTEPRISEEMLAKATVTTQFLKSLSHPARLVVLCRLTEGQAIVGELEELLNLPQAEVSKQLARLRADGLVLTRREGRNVIYSLADERTTRIVRTLHAEFCV